MPCPSIDEAWPLFAGKTFWTWASESGEPAGVKCYAHLLRHAFATKLAEDPTVDTRSWMELMNHANLGQFRRYTAARQDHFRAAVEAL